MGTSILRGIMGSHTFELTPKESFNSYLRFNPMTIFATIWLVWGDESSPLQCFAAVGWSGKCGDTKNWQTKNFSLNPADSGEMWAGSSAADVQWSPAAQTRRETQKIVIRQVLLQRKWRALWRRTNLGFEQTRAQVKWCEACLMGPGADAGIHWRSSLVLQKLWNRQCG